jgi:23S rRNA pseudouridine1911/1915/1917 synthase
LTLFRFQPSDLSSPIRIDQYLSQQDGLPSRSQLRQLFDEGRVRLDGEPARPSAKLRGGEAIEVEVPAPVPSALAAEPIALTVIHEDADLIVFDKPAGLLTHPIPGVATGTLVNALLHHCHGLSGIGGELKPGIVHRLDKLTSGVMVAAKNDRAHQGLAAQFKAHSIERRYLAVVYGQMDRLTGTFATVIGRDPHRRLRMTAQLAAGRRAVTHYRVRSRAAGFTLVELRLETGRTHQIRVHLSEHNHPVAGDPLYGKGRAAPTRLAPEQKAALHHLHRQALHAYYLGFRHPITDVELAFVSPFPEDIASLAHALGLDQGVELPAAPARIK